ncbi:putative GINS DNA replication complex subunit Sld5 [Aspergillus undulatus]|uniref:putative GINS DNA replication complex subunit Sld5 n=1 Tax=Aspergillus undulatus TaxID=1810928 RepID=UPI003CCCA306
MDIDDILASVDHADVSNPESTALDHQLLTRFWVAERSVPELLPWPARLMDRMMERVRQQIETIEDLAAASSDPTSTTASSSSQNATLTLSILQTDLSRTQYLLRSLLRQRLSKITKHSMHYLLSTSSSAPIPSPASGSTEAKLQQPEDSVPIPPEPLPRTCALSPSEATFLYTHQQLLARHFGASFLSSFPAQLRRLDDNAGGTSMVQGPDKREVVFVRCVAEEVSVLAPPEQGVSEEEILGGTMRMGDVWVVRWEGVKHAWERGDVEVL